MTRAIVCTLGLALASCTHAREEPPEMLPIAVPTTGATLEEVTALARDYTEKEYQGAGQIWLNHLRAPSVKSGGIVVIDEGDPIEVTFTMRRMHSRDVCQTLRLTSRGWTGRNDGCDHTSVEARCTAEEALVRAAASGLPTADAFAVRLDASRGEPTWTITVHGAAVEFPDDCGQAAGARR